jgi:hypothetical protein
MACNSLLRHHFEGKSQITYERKGKVVPVFNKAPRHEDVLGVWRYVLRKIILYMREEVYNKGLYTTNNFAIYTGHLMLLQQ